MNEYIELISQLKPKNRQTFPIADTRDLIGGYVLVADIESRNDINSLKLRLGMLCYVLSEDKIYKYTGTSWEEFTVGGNSIGYNLDFPGVENDGNLDITLEQYDAIISNQLISFNNKYTVIGKEVLNVDSGIVCRMIALTDGITMLLLEITKDGTTYTLSSTKTKILDLYSIANTEGNSDDLAASQKLVTSLITKLLTDTLKLINAKLDKVYEVDTYEQLKLVVEGNVIYLKNNIVYEYTAYQWLDYLDEFTCYTDTLESNILYANQELTVKVYNESKYTKSIEHQNQGLVTVLYIYDNELDKQIHRCVYIGSSVVSVNYPAGFYIKTSTGLLKLASQVDLPTKISELVNDSNYVYTVNNKQSTDGTVTINGEDINVSFLINDALTGETLDYENTVSGMGLEIFNNMSLMLLYLDEVYANKANASDIPTKVSQLDNDSKFATMDEVNRAIYTSIIVTLNTDV